MKRNPPKKTRRSGFPWCSQPRQRAPCLLSELFWFLAELLAKFITCLTKLPLRQTICAFAATLSIPVALGIRSTWALLAIAVTATCAILWIEHYKPKFFQRLKKLALNLCEKAKKGHGHQ